MELRIAFKKTVIELVQGVFCQLAIFSGGCHIILVSHLEYHFVKSFFLFAITDFFVVVFNTAVFSFLLCIELRQSIIKQLVVCVLDGSVAILDVSDGFV